MCRKKKKEVNEESAFKESFYFHMGPQTTPKTIFLIIFILCTYLSVLALFCPSLLLFVFLFPQDPICGFELHLQSSLYQAPLNFVAETSAADYDGGSISFTQPAIAPGRVHLQDLVVCKNYYDRPFSTLETNNLSSISLISPAVFAMFLPSLVSLHNCTASPSLTHPRS